ncbi:MAG: LPS export ABC transporter ATP-binding protein [Acidobacteria bacterium]|nr:LPS export ABC transporter ATP-binding protein [Acidobacteriota bacterium]MBU4307445.1 LPS export ABC transporter ATP-binding protein [Acidobacteriota bacterium]MBU4405577.1 LPS export ABC transporter ATP-binding protein [Acidobacteriota bacterium]MCG2812114.1 LPS export ABC transporter ATP-binding protein [Candidatus Aminicenantes bacterium]
MNRLQTRDLTKIYNRIPVVDGINLEFKSGKITALLGRNGAGKTTTFLMMAGIVKPDSGSVEFNGENVNGIPSYERSQKGLIYLPQQHSVFMKATVFDNLFMVLEMHNPAGEARQKTMDLLNDFGLLAVKDSSAHQLSGGEKRRLEIARSMIMAPSFLFMDEPFTGIDPITIMDIQTIILKLKARGIGIIITDHNVKDTFYITDLAYIIHKGHILSSGTPAQVVQEEKTRQVFLGKDFEWHG